MMGPIPASDMRYERTVIIFISKKSDELNTGTNCHTHQNNLRTGPTRSWSPRLKDECVLQNERASLSYADVCEAESTTATASVVTDDGQPAVACVPVCSLSGDEEEEELEHSSIAVEDFVVLP